MSRKEIIKITEDDQVTTYSWRAFHCELCNSKFADNIPNPRLKGEWLSLFELSKPEKNYIILESYLSEGVIQESNSQWQKNMHVVNFASDFKSNIRLGRGNDSDIRFDDISVSRIHAFIKRDPTDNSFYLEDNTSKFGTLVQLQKPL